MVEEKSAGLKYKMYSAHDCNLSYLMPSLNLTSYECIEELFFTGHTDKVSCVKSPKCKFKKKK